MCHKKQKYTKTYFFIIILQTQVGFQYINRVLKVTVYIIILRVNHKVRQCIVQVLQGANFKFVTVPYFFVSLKQNNT